MVKPVLTLLHSERPKLYRVLAGLSAVGLRRSPKGYNKTDCLRQGPLNTGSLVLNFGSMETEMVAA